MYYDTIIGIPYPGQPTLKSMLQEARSPKEIIPEAADSRVFTIRSADSHGERSSANVLINRMYATRGYCATPLPHEQKPTRITLVASEEETTVGTITVGFDSCAGLHLEDLFAEEAAALRLSGHRLCEFTKLAMDSVVKSKHVLASLFHVAFIYAYRVMACDSLLIEVNPRHVRYYERMLGFRALGPERLNTRVNAPAVLMCLDLVHAQDQIERFGGKPEYSLLERSLYPYFFSVPEEAGIVGRLQQSSLALLTSQAWISRQAHSLASH